MPSINQSIKINNERRIRINTCEGEVSISDEIPSERGGGLWQIEKQITMPRDTAQALVAALSEQMAKHY